MQSNHSAHCACTNCPGASCTCGCRGNTAPMLATPSGCGCGAACRCDSADQGCLCR
jgi:hypothetical protein